MINFIEKEGGEVGVVKLEGDITVQQADELKQCLMQALGSVAKVYVDSSKASCIDLSCLQLLCAAHRAATRMEKSFQLAEPVTGQFRCLADTAGFTRHTGCRLDITKTCIWVGLFSGPAILS